MGAKNVRFGSDIAEDEIDLDGGFVMIPDAIPEPWVGAEQACRLVDGIMAPEGHPGRRSVRQSPNGRNGISASMPIETSCMQLGRRWPTSPISAAR